jgi:hypothetical protein
MRYMNHEESVVTAFFLPNRRERYLEIVRDPKKRRKLINELSVESPIYCPDHTKSTTRPSINELAKL